jgi:hypothetical protein
MEALFLEKKKPLHLQGSGSYMKNIEIYLTTGGSPIGGLLEPGDCFLVIFSSYALFFLLV